MAKLSFHLDKHVVPTMCAVLLITSQLFSSVSCAVPTRIVHKTIADNLMSSALISSAAALGPRPRPSIPLDLALAAPGQSASAAIAPIAAAVASQAISNAISGAGAQKVSLLSAYPTLSAAVAMASDAAPSVLNSNVPGISLQRRMLRALAKEAFAYLAAPLFMPGAISRALFQPEGLPQEQALLRRFGRFLSNRLRQPNRSSQQVKPLNKAQIKLLINAVKYRNAYKKKVH